jgi:hypothetical protein
VGLGGISLQLPISLLSLHFWVFSIMLRSTSDSASCSAVIWIVPQYLTGSVIFISDLISLITLSGVIPVGFRLSHVSMYRILYIIIHGDVM